MLATDDLVRGDNVFFCATGVTDGDLLSGVRYWADGVHHAVDGDALEVGHDPHDRRLSPADQAAEYASVDFDLPEDQLTAEPPLP